MKYKMEFIIIILMLGVLISCTKENHSDLKTTKIQILSDEEMTEILKNTIEFIDNSEIEKKILEIITKIKKTTLPKKKNELFLHKAKYEIALLRYHEAKGTLLKITKEKDAMSLVQAMYLLGVVEFSLSNDFNAKKWLSIVKKVVPQNDPSNTRITLLLKTLNYIEKQKQLMKIREYLLISNKNNCRFLDVSPGNYTVTWSGECKDGLTSGNGILKYSKGTVFTGIMEKGDFIKGKYSFSDESFFDGSFENGLFKKGCITHSDGSKYCGEFKNALYDGHGVFYTAEKNKFGGSFKQGSFVEGNAFCANGKKTKWKAMRSPANGMSSIFFDCK